MEVYTSSDLEQKREAVNKLEAAVIGKAHAAGTSNYEKLRKILYGPRRRTGGIKPRIEPGFSALAGASGEGDARSDEVQFAPRNFPLDASTVTTCWADPTDAPHSTRQTGFG
jgi:hypothetical protein